ncbi:MAG TPA: peptidylprolyl isomerase [Burkholderiales bacterium]
MKTWIIAAACMALPALALGQELPTKKKAPAKPASIATVNGVAVPQSRMNLMLQRQGQRGMPDNEQTRAMVREELINRELIAQEAQRTGIGKRPEVQTQVDFARQEILVNAYITDWVRTHPISEDDVKQEYERVKSRAGDKEYRARHILLETEEQANEVIAELRKGGKFEELASKSSKDTGSAQRGGDLDWAVPGTYDPQFSAAMVKLEKGKYTEQPVRTRFGYHVIRLEDVRAIEFPALNEARPRIQQSLVQNRLGDLVKSLRAKARIQ